MSADLIREALAEARKEHWLRDGHSYTLAAGLPAVGLLLALADALARVEKERDDPAYSPAYQDEYQRLWHEAAAERDRLRTANERLQDRVTQLEERLRHEAAENERLVAVIAELDPYAILARKEP